MYTRIQYSNWCFKRQNSKQKFRLELDPLDNSLYRPRKSQQPDVYLKLLNILSDLKVFWNTKNVIAINRD